MLRRSARIPQCTSRMFVRCRAFRKPGEDRVANPAQPGHRARLDTTHAISDDELRAVLELVNEARNLAEVVREVGVHHDDVVAAGSGQPGQIRAPVAASPLLDHEGTGRPREIAAAVGRAVVDDDHLAQEAVFLEHRARRGDALGDRLRLVEAGDDDGYPTRRRRCCSHGHAHVSLGGYAPCTSASSTTACTRTRSAEPSAGTETSPSGWPPLGHDVTFLTLRQWERGAEPDVPGVRVVAAGPRMALYTRSGRRRLLPPIVFGIGVLGHLLRHGRRYDIVHTASFPYFSLLAAAAARRRGGFRVVVDWHEVWTRAYWREYLGPLRRPDRLVGAACVSPRAPARLLLLEAARASSARARAPRLS